MGFNIYDTETKDFTEIYTPAELSKKVLDTVTYYKDRADTLQKANTKLLEDALACADRQLKEENKILRKRLKLSIVELANEKELNAYDRFMADHMKCRMISKINGGKVPYVTQEGVGVGYITKVHCPICNMMEDITDTGAW